MKKSTALQSIAASALFASAGSALAHESHGLASRHWHSSDSLGFATVAFLAVAAWWLSLKK
jgi:hypothetical protein